MNGSSPGWYPDPTARFELRYHNGVTWTADVSNDGQRFVDPSGTAPVPVRPASGPPVPGSPDGNRLATASMVVGITAIVIGWMPFVVVAGVVLAVLALAFGFVGRRRARTAGVGGGFALAGIVTGAVGLAVCAGGVVFTVALVDAVDRYERPAAHEIEITSCDVVGDEWVAVGTITNVSAGEAAFSVRVHFVRSGTGNVRRSALVEVEPLAAGEATEFTAARSVDLDEVDCLVGAVRGPLPFGFDPGT